MCILRLIEDDEWKTIAKTLGESWGVMQSA